MAVLKYREPGTDNFISIGVPGISDHSKLENLDIGDPHPQYILRTGGPDSAMTGPLFLTTAPPFHDRHAVTKSYVDGRVGAFVQPDDPGDPDSTINGTRGQLWIDTDEGIDGAGFVPLIGQAVLQGPIHVNNGISGPSASSATTGYRRITISTDPPTDGVGRDGDIWFQRTT